MLPKYLTTDFMGFSTRQFHPGSTLTYNYYIYNALLSNGQPSIKTQIRLLKDEQVGFTSEIAALKINNQPDLTKLTAEGELELGQKATPGQYVLQVLVCDELAKPEQSLVTQQIDFTIVK